MANIIKVYKQTITPVRFIGKAYTNADRVNGSFGAKWGEWFKNGWFEVLENHGQCIPTEAYEDGGAYIGLMNCGNGDEFEYLIGMLKPSDTDVPEGFVHLDFEGGELGVCWVQGKESDVYRNEGKCQKMMTDNGYVISNGWHFERYNHSRFTTPNENGEIILDICFFTE